MIFPPAIISIGISGNRRPLRLWLPIILLWPFILIGMLLLVPVALITQIILNGSIKPFSILITLYELMTALCGTSIRVTAGINSHSENVSVFIQ